MNWPELEYLSDIQLKLIKEEEIANKINVDEEVKKIIEWINEQPHLPKYLDDETRIRKFLYGRKFSIEKTKKTLDAYYTIRGALPELFDNRDPLGDDIQNIMKSGYAGVFPKLTHEGYRIIFLGNKNPDRIPTMEIFYKYLIMMADMLLLKDQNRGLILFADFETVTLKRMMLHTPTLIQKLLYFGLNCYPCRIKGMYCINVPTYFEFVGNIVKSTLSEKLQKRFFIYAGERDYTKLQEIAGRDNLPTEFGGTLGPLEDMIEVWNQALVSERDWFLREESRKTDESRRDGKDKFDPEAVFGMTGSFRKLTVD